MSMVNAGRMQKWNNNKEKGTTVADPLYVYASLSQSLSIQRDTRISASASLSSPSF